MQMTRSNRKLLSHRTSLERSKERSAVVMHRRPVRRSVAGAAALTVVIVTGVAVGMFARGYLESDAPATPTPHAVHRFIDRALYAVCDPETFRTAPQPLLSNAQRGAECMTRSTTTRIAIGQYELVSEIQRDLSSTRIGPHVVIDGDNNAITVVALSSGGDRASLQPLADLGYKVVGR